MKYRIIEHQHIFEEESQFAQCHASTICPLPDGQIAAAWFGGTHEKAPDVAVWFSRRVNGVWSRPVIAADAEHVPCWNPVLFLDGDRLLLFYKVGNEIPSWQTFVKESLDFGESWSKERELVPGDFGGRGPVKNKPIRLADGAILAGASTEEGCWDCFADRSEDGGKTWKRSANVPIDHAKLKGMGIIQPTLWQSKDGSVHMLIRSSEGVIYRSDSADGGRNWCPAYPTDLPNNNSGIDLTRLEDGRLVLVCNPVLGNWAARTPIVFQVSSDDGQTWGTPQILDHVTEGTCGIDAGFSYPAVVARENEIFLTYTWKRKNIAYWRIQF